MKESPETIKNTYTVIDVLKHEELIPFINLYIKKKNRYSYMYNISNLVCIGTVIYALFFYKEASGTSFGTRFSYISFGIALSFLLLPIHELLHALAYKMAGAKKTGIKANLKKFYFMAVADQFVASRKEFVLIAITPFVVISTALIILAACMPFQYQLMVVSALMAHTAMCSGDFGLLSYFEFHKHKTLVTYDDIEAGESYFLEKSSQDS